MAAIVFLFGLCCISFGVGMLCLPAGIIAAGLGLIALSIILSKGSAPDNSEYPRHGR